MNDTSTAIPRRLDDPPRMFWWDLDQSLIVMAMMIVGLMCGLFFCGRLIGLVFGHLYGRTKSGKHPAYALHLMYWYLPASVSALKNTPPSYLRQMQG